MHWQQVRVNGEDFVGLLGYACDTFALLPPIFPEVKVLKVPELRLNLYGSNLLGLFCSGNSSALLLPYYVTEKETEKLKSFLTPLEVNVVKIEDKHTALGNLIAANDKGALISPKIEDVKVIEDALGVEVEKRSIAGYEEVGACILPTNKGFIAHPDLEEEIEFLKDLFKVSGNVGSVNFGFPFVKSGIIANSFGYITGLNTSGIELGRIDEALGFL